MRSYAEVGFGFVCRAFEGPVERPSDHAMTCRSHRVSLTSGRTERVRKSPQTAQFNLMGVRTVARVLALSKPRATRHSS